MKIVFHRYNSICEPGYIDAFRELGIDVVEDELEMHQKNIPSDVRIETIARLILSNRPLFVFSINYFPYISDICEKLGVMYVCVSVDCPVLELLDISVRNSCNRIFLFDRRQYLDICDENPGHVFILPLGVNPLIKPDPEIMEHITDPESGKPDYRYDVSFVGSLYNEKNPFSDIAPQLPDRICGGCEAFLGAQEILGGTDLIEMLMGEDGIAEEIRSGIGAFAPGSLPDNEHSITDIKRFWTIHGCFASELTVRDRLVLLSSAAESINGTGTLDLFTGSDTSMLSALSSNIRVHGRVKTLSEMPNVFALSRINLNTTMRAIRSGLPQRIWDVLGCGGFLLTDACAELSEVLVPGKHLETYSTVEEACDKIGYYLSHENEREEIARRGHEEAIASHTILKRVVAMINAIMNGQQI